MRYLLALIAAFLVGCGTQPVTIPENVSGVFCNYVETLTTKVTTVVVQADSGDVATSPQCEVLIHK